MTLRQLAAEPPTIPTRSSWHRQIGTFRVAELQAECPGVGLDWIRRLLARLRKEKKIKSLGTGRGAKWQKMGN